MLMQKRMLVVGFSMRDENVHKAIDEVRKCRTFHMDESQKGGAPPRSSPAYAAGPSHPTAEHAACGLHQSARTSGEGSIGMGAGGGRGAVGPSMGGQGSGASDFGGPGREGLGRALAGRERPGLSRGRQASVLFSGVGGAAHTRQDHDDHTHEESSIMGTVSAGSRIMVRNEQQGDGEE